MLGSDPEGNYPKEGIWVNSACDSVLKGNVYDDEHI